MPRLAKVHRRVTNAIDLLARRREAREAKERKIAEREAKKAEKKPAKKTGRQKFGDEIAKREAREARKAGMRILDTRKAESKPLIEVTDAELDAKLGEAAKRMEPKKIQIVELEPHPLSQLLPTMRLSEYEALKADIRREGVGILDPIITLDGKILDGRHRYRAYVELAAEGCEVSLPVKSFSGADPLKFVHSKLLHRHLDDSQKACAAVLYGNQFEADATARMKAGKTVQPDQKGLARDQLGALFGISGTYVQMAKGLMEADRKSFDTVFNGQETLTRANAAVKRAAKSAMIKKLHKAVENGDPATSAWVINEGDSIELMAIACTLDGTPICVATSNRRLPFNATAQEVREAQQANATNKRKVRDYLEARPRLARDQVQQMLLARHAKNAKRAAENPDPAPQPPNLQPVRSEHEDAISGLRRAVERPAMRVAVGAESMSFGELGDRLAASQNAQAETADAGPDPFSLLNQALGRSDE